MTSRIEYKFKPNALQGERRIVAGGSQLDVYGKSGKLKRSLPYRDIAALQYISGGAVQQEDGSRFDIVLLKLIPRHGRSLLVKSGSFCGMATFADQSSEFQRMSDFVQASLSMANPSAKIVYGSKLVSILLYFTSFCLFGTLLVVLTAFLMGELPPEQKWRLLISVVGFCVAVGPVSLLAAKSMWPVTGHQGDGQMLPPLN